AGELSARLRALGGRVIEFPLLAFAPPESWVPFDTAWAGLTPATWVVFTSATAVARALERIAELGHAAARLGSARLAAVGGKTADALHAQGLAVEIVPGTRFQAEGLLEALRPHVSAGDRVWMPRAEAAREALVEGLRALGADVAVTPVYRTVLPQADPEGLRAPLLAGEVDWLLFTSSSTVEHFFQALGARAAAQLAARGWPRVACLGAVVARTARARGLEVAVQPARQDLDGLLEALVAHVAGSPGRAHQAGNAAGEPSMNEVPEIGETLSRRARQFLLHSFLYYRLGESVIGDEAFDRNTEELRALRAAHPRAPMPYAELIDPALGPEASGYQIRRYPPEIVSAAFKVLYAATHPDLSFEEFVTGRGYQVVWPAAEATNTGG
ncbi:MAG: uroporphyrinogen-III synthase, partial [Candidatus Lambdaproteobacteria bacterium]|nr:uroporphyrinogen-III synthase [Candidatus Lambdaproteobacteria bacterium]